MLPISMTSGRTAILWACLLGLYSAAVPVARADTCASREVTLESTALGAYEYRTYCASCHGADGKGNGMMASMLKVWPSDLTILSKTNGGDFPHDRLTQLIDGRAEIMAHGARDMPVWGDWFNRQVAHQQLFGGELVDVIVKGRIESLLTYLQSLQVK